MSMQATAGLFTTREAAEYLRMSKSWLDHARLDGSGPDFVKLGGSIFYPRSSLDAFIARNLVRVGAS